MNTFQLKMPVNLFFGPGSIDKLPEAVRGLGRRALIVSGTGSARKTGLLTKVVTTLEAAGVKCVTFEKVTPNPASTTVGEGVELALSQSCDFVVGIGGGSPIDAAKAIALCAVSGGKIADYQPGGKYADATPQGALPVVAIPTTAGTGTEIDRYLVVTNAENREKPGIGFDCTYPVASIVDPELMVSVPAGVTADTGVDVLYHALEAYLSKGATLFTDMIAKEAIDLVVKNLERVLADGGDLEARTNMAWASTLAGLAIDLGGTVAIHGAAHPISGRLNATHGQTLAAISVAYMRHNWQANPDKFAVLARLMGRAGDGMPVEALAAESPAALKAFLQRVGRDITVSSLGVTREMIPQLAEDAFKTMRGALDNNPRELTLEDVMRLYEDSL